MEIGELCKLKPGDKVKTSKDLFVDDEDEIMPDTTYTVNDAVFEVVNSSNKRMKIGIGELNKKYKLRSAEIILDEFPGVHYSHKYFN